MKKSKTVKVVRALAVFTVTSGAFSAAMATNGYFSHGYGIKAKGMGGASITSTDNAFAGANNPAAAAWAGNRLDVGLDFFAPDRGMTRTGSMGPGGPGQFDMSVKSDKNLFAIPELGFNRAMNDNIGVGVTVYGNGGMNTDYAGGQLNCGMGPANALCGGGRLGVDLIQLIVAPTIAYKFGEGQSVGLSPLFVHQRFRAEGLQGFTPGSSAPGSLTNTGTDTSNGVGVRLGYLGKFSDRFSVGASYSPKVRMSAFSKYSGLFAEGGRFDIPANYTVGASFQATPSILMALDYQRILYSGVQSISNSSAQGLTPLGAGSGPGFGWSDIDVVKFGVQWQATPQLALRGGINHGGNPIQGRDVTFNILAPGVVTTHYTAGATYALSPNTEVSMSFMHAPRQTVSGPTALPFGGTESIRMSQNAVGVQFGWKY